ncbi:hypothetical protein Q31b_53610 [Novipirellula aureliae]|uniref:DUF4272 domain-containing protein n=1 Tax=Novipirellula aureliae TaxID=2527966 RepID=A0A5C6DGF7_9BACT|nr:hypothetical protein Q31b_53610 [Novipirellula aureliae]
MPLQIHAYSTLRMPIAPDFPCRSLHQEHRLDAHLPPSLQELMNRVMEGGNREMTQSLYAVMRHIERVHHHYRFEIAEAELQQISKWAWESNSILVYPDRSVRDPAGHRLVDTETGLPDEHAKIPFPVDARERKLVSEQTLRNRLIDTPESLPPVISELEVEFRDADEVAWRCLALFMVAVRAESLSAGKPIPIGKLREKSPMAFEALTPNEIEFLNTDHPDQQSVVNFLWRYEALFTLQWALGMHAHMPFPDEICDVPKVAELQIAQPNRLQVAEAELRQGSSHASRELLDAVDMNYRMLWAARNAKVHDQTPPSGIDGGVISERQHALNWIIQFENADWDDVDIPS